MTIDFYSWFSIVLLLVAFVVDLAIPRFFRRSPAASPARIQDRWSAVFVLLSTLLSVGFGIAFRWLGWGLSSGPFQYTGLVLMLLGFTLREWALIRLGRFFSRRVGIEAGHSLVTDGPYQWLRHPAYTGMLLVKTGFCMAFGTWFAPLACLAVSLPANIYRIQVEEEVLLQTFGEEYQRLMKHTWRLFPGW